MTAATKATTPDALSLAVLAAAWVHNDTTHWGDMYRAPHPVGIDVDWFVPRSGRATFAVESTFPAAYFMDDLPYAEAVGA